MKARAELQNEHTYAALHVARCPESSQKKRAGGRQLFIEV